MRRVLVMGGAASRWLPFDGGALHALVVEGEGALPPVVLLHGFSASGPSQYWTLLATLKREVSRIIVPDLPGHGMSSTPIGLNGDLLQRGLDDALDQLLDEPTVIFASSLSGALAIRFALRHPSRVRGLALCSPGGVPLERDEQTELVSLFCIDDHAAALAFVDRLFPRGHFLRHAYAWGIRQQFNRPHLRRLLEGVGEERFLEADELARLTMPVHLIWGELERVLPARHFRFFQRNLPKSATVDRPEDYGHAPFLHRGKDLADRIVAFCRRV